MANRRATAKKTAKTRKLKAAGKKAGQTRRLRAAGKKAELTKKLRAAARKAAATLKLQHEQGAPTASAAVTSSPETQATTAPDPVQQ